MLVFLASLTYTGFARRPANSPNKATLSENILYIIYMYIYKGSSQRLPAPLIYPCRCFYSLDIILCHPATHTAPCNSHDRAIRSGVQVVDTIKQALPTPLQFFIHGSSLSSLMIRCASWLKLICPCASLYSSSSALSISLIDGMPASLG